LNGKVLSFSARASEPGKLYGSITTQMIADSITEKTGVEINKRQVFTQPLRTLGEHNVQIRLTVDLVPEVTVVVNREGEELEEIIIQEPVRPEGEEELSEAEVKEQAEASSEVEKIEAEEELSEAELGEQAEASSEVEELEAEEEPEPSDEIGEPEVDAEPETSDEFEESEEELENADDEETAE